MKLTGFILGLLCVCNAQAQDFDRWFDDQTMRFDYYHCGDARSEEFYFGDMHADSGWAGSRVSLVDTMGYGSQQLRILDAASGRLIYSRGFCTLWGEWKTTAEAKKLRKSMPESVIFPMPRAAVMLELYSRDYEGEWIKKYEQQIDPKSYFVARNEPRYEAFDVEVNGPVATSIDVVLVPEGYASDERAEFEKAARQFADDLFSFEPYKELRGKFNIRAVWAPSVQSGVTMPGAGVWRDTAVGASFWTFDSERYQMTEDLQNLRRIVAGVPNELIYVLSNTDKYGGGGIYNFYGISSAREGMRSRAGVYVHEFGHLLLGLGDEYIGGVSYDELSMYPTHREPWEANLTTLVDFKKKYWAQILPESTPIPTPVGKPEVLGVYEGGGYAMKGVYRPWPNCLMNNLHAISKFCPVCTKAIRDQIEFLCR